MITIDRASNTPVHEQLVSQLRYLIASGQFQFDETLPSTRTLGDQVGVSFHTVRKAYQELEAEGWLEARVGSGYRVRERAPLSKSDRIEQGATVVQQALQRLIGLGLKDTEIEYLFQEQLEVLAGERIGQKIVFAAPYQEMADLCCEQISMALQQTVEAVPFDALSRHQDADYVLARFADIRRVMDILPRVDAVGVVTYLKPDVLEQVARMLPQETLGVITRHADAIQPLTHELRDLSGFKGQTIAASIDEGARHLSQFIDQTDLFVYTPPCRRRLLPYLETGHKHLVVRPVVGRESLEHIRQTLPS